MNIIVFISWLAIFAGVTLYSEDLPILTLTYHHGMKLNKIPETGSPFMFKQLCTTTIDSIISSGNVIFMKSKIGRIKNCSFQWQIREDTLRAIIIETFKEKNTQQVIKQANYQFGSPVEINAEKLTTTYEWRRRSEKTEIKARMVVNKELGAGVLTVTN